MVVVLVVVIIVVIVSIKAKVPVELEDAREGKILCKKPITYAQCKVDHSRKSRPPSSPRESKRETKRTKSLRVAENDTSY